MTDKADRFAAASSTGCLGGEDLPGEGEDFDALLAASSFGSDQARTIREQAPAAAREHARRVMAGEEKPAPVPGDIDDAVGGLVYGLARGVVPGPTVVILDGFDLTPRDLITAWSGRPVTDLRLVVYAVCQTDVLWPDQRTRLLESLIAHNAFAGLRPDVAWNIVNWAFDVPRPSRVLLECASLAVEQIDVGAIAGRWLASCPADPGSSGLPRPTRRPAAFPERREQSGLDPGPAGPGPARARGELTAGSAASLHRGQPGTGSTVQRGPSRRRPATRPGPPPCGPRPRPGGSVAVARRPRGGVMLTLVSRLPVGRPWPGSRLLSECRGLGPRPRLPAVLSVLVVAFMVPVALVMGSPARMVEALTATAGLVAVAARSSSRR